MSSYVALIVGLVGALIGAAASIVTVVIQSRGQARRDKTREAVALALQDWKSRVDIINERGGKILPLAVFVHYHSRLLELAESGKLTPETIKALSVEQDRLVDAIDEINEAWLKRTRSGGA